MSVSRGARVGEEEPRTLLVVAEDAGDAVGPAGEIPAVDRGSNAWTGAHALNQATPWSIGTRITVAHGRWCAVSIAPTGSKWARIQSSVSRSKDPVSGAVGDAQPQAAGRQP
ncbi:MAG: hypothetical protein ACRDH7_05290 [Actinomycetota bacterium]